MNGRAEVSRLRKRLDATFLRMPLASDDMELQADYAKYLCVLVSGFFENAIVALILDYVERRSAPQVMSFVERKLDRWTNPSTDKIRDLFSAFSEEWRVSIEDLFKDERKASVNSLVALRHRIAHGESVTTSLSQIKAHYKVILAVVDQIADLVDPSA